MLKWHRTSGKFFFSDSFEKYIGTWTFPLPTIQPKRPILWGFARFNLKVNPIVSITVRNGQNVAS